MNKEFNCPHLAECSGCQPLATALHEQQALKVKNLTDHLQPRSKPVIHSLGPGFLRTRMDITWHKDHWGFWNKNKQSLIDLQECQQVTAELQAFFLEFKKIHWPVAKASARLRVSPTRERGVWLDLANEDIKNLLTEGQELQALTKIASVEIGQRRKSLVWRDDRWRLGEPEFKPWISTFVKGKEVPLQSLVGGFSQTGPAATKVVSAVIEEFLTACGSKNILEFGSGFGTLTLPAASQPDRRVFALEVDERSLEGLRRTLHSQGITNVDCVLGDFQRKSAELGVAVDTYLVNPPRSGVQRLFENLPGSVKCIVYMSCYPESFFKDAVLLREQDFELIRAELVDQFPQTPHAEWMTLWQKK